MTEHETTASLRRAAPLRWWTILWAGALWVAAVVLLVTVAFGCSAGSEPDDGAPAASGAEARPPDPGADPGAGALSGAGAPAAPETTDRRPGAPVPLDCESAAGSGVGSVNANAARAAAAGFDDPAGLAAAEDLAAWAEQIAGECGHLYSPETEQLRAWARARARDRRVEETAAEDLAAAAEAGVAEAEAEAIAAGLLDPDGWPPAEPEPGNPEPEAEGDPDPGPGNAEPEPEGEPEPEPGNPDPEADPDPEPPTGTLDPEWEDRPAEAPEGQPAAPQHPGPVELADPVTIGDWPALARLLCPAEADWSRGGFESCGDFAAPLDYLNPDALTWRRCFHPPVRLGVGDTYRWEGALEFDEPNAWGVVGYRMVLTGEIHGFSAPVFSGDGRWAWTTPTVTEKRTYWYDLEDGTTDREDWDPHIGPAFERWIQAGDGPDARGLDDGGGIAWGLLAVSPPVEFQEC